jgi:hypothetical protein
VGASGEGVLSGVRVRVEDAVVVARAEGVSGATALVNALRAEPVVVVAHEADPTGWIVAASGGAVAIVGAILLGVFAGDLDAVAQPHDGETYRSAMGRQGNAELLVGIGGAALGVGVIAAGIGIGLALSSGHDEHASARLRVGVGSLSLEGEF